MFSKSYLAGRSLSQLKSQRESLMKELQRYHPFAMGTLQFRHHVCQKAGCKCMHPTNPQPHGPYHYLAFRGTETPGMLVLSKEQLPAAKKLLKNYDHFWETMKKISSINVELLKRKEVATL